LSICSAPAPEMKRPATEEGVAPDAPLAPARAAAAAPAAVWPAEDFGPVPEPQRFRRVRVIRSAKDSGERLSELEPLTLGVDGSAGAQASSIFVLPTSCDAKPFLGFGGSFTEASAVVLLKMSEKKQEEVLRAYFDPEQGIGYSMGRIPIASCDFSLGNWTCGELPESDPLLSGFSLDHYRPAILPLFKRALAARGAPIRLLASPWSPVPWMKTKNRFNGDGHLRPECAASWALHFVKFVRGMEEFGVPIWAVSVQNEPEAAQSWESCIYTAREEKDFVRDHLGPTLEQNGLGSVKILVWDHNRDGMFERAATAYTDPEAAKYIWGVGYHWYGDARFEIWPRRSEVPYEDRQRGLAPLFELRARNGFDNVRKVAELRPDKHIIFTEGCQELAGRPLQKVLGLWKFGERYGMNIIADLNSGTEGWIDWNLYLDETGGPNHQGNLCVAPIICDTKQDEVLYQPAFWFLGHFSKYIKPGARRVLTSTSRDALEVVSFLNLDGSLAMVVMNQSADKISFWLKLPDGAVKTVAPPRSITTFLLDAGGEAPGAAPRQAARL